MISNSINKATTTKKLTSKNMRLKDLLLAGLLCYTRHKQYLSLKCKKIHIIKN